MRRLFLPWPRDRHATRLVYLFTGLVLYGVGLALLVRAQLGLDPWDCLHQGLGKVTGISIGTMSILVSFVVLLLWIPLRQRLGFGTLSNAVVVGLVLDGALALLPPVHALAWRIPFLLVAVVTVGLATALYVGAGLGPGPRDGLMTGLHRKGLSIRVARTGIELSVLLVGWLLGGSVGVGTVVFAACIGPLVQLFVRWVALEPI